MSDRRRAHRLPVSLRAEYRSATGARTVVVENLSRGGVFFRDQGVDSMGSEVALTIQFQGSPVELAGEVVRIVNDDHASGVGIRFTALANEARRELANYVIERHCQSHN